MGFGGWQISWFVPYDLQYGSTNLAEIFRVDQVHGGKCPRERIFLKNSNLKNFC